MKEQEHQIIGLIYDAAMDTRLWPQVIEAIVHYTNSKTAIFTALDQLSPSYDFVHTYNIPQACIDAYQDERIKVIDMKLHAPLWQQIGVGDTIEQNLQSYGQMPGTDEYIFYERCLEPTGICHIAAVLLDQGQHRWAVLGIHRVPDAQPYSPEEHEFLKRIGKHLRRALQIHRQINLIQQDNLSLYTVLDSLKTGIVLLDQNLCLSYSNPVAQKMLDQSSCLDLDIHNRLKTNYAQQVRFDQLLESALLEDTTIQTEVGGVLALSDGAGSQFMLTVVPFKKLRNMQHLQSAQHQIALFMTDKNQHYSLSRAYLQQCYQLSKREFDLCELLINGYKIEDIAEQCGITLSSVRTYFKNIYEKTQCCSQIELMHLLMGCTIHFEHIK
ncbi:helix-turn-helix transcriptional regulator [Acinetobacter indicus]|uniref:LuxR C-terminal-related transcriptional regulator n=1 Tax=Acinetobacter indicus TaxID=756892 RepID=UPI000FD958FB|nr:LuxR C-terminal-related transcriptional regulator [Acinetobacter indicus]QFS16810.1 helix-turn-helix transcriptional regulator [Acinetobacter indicus]QIC74031.1 helix-turn-helix transcriptional regulator [Acinetobacter indicus]RVT55375.1 helix-turn-helix transcriptional regulator [Acinetobacter indicus]